MLNRRPLIAAPIGLAACATIAKSPDHQFLDRVIAAAGGERALNAARVLSWTGQAVVTAGERTLTIGVDTVVEPFSYARSETWLVSEGRASTRILEIDGDRSWATRNGQRDPMPDAQTTHERQQYAIYGLMRFVTLRDPGASFSVHGDDEPFIVAGHVWPGTRYTMVVEHPAAPRTQFSFDEDYRLIAAANAVSNPEADRPPVVQTFRFFETIEGQGVRWPRRMVILQAIGTSSSSFELTLDTFTPRQRR